MKLGVYICAAILMVGVFVVEPTAAAKDKVDLSAISGKTVSIKPCRVTGDGCEITCAAGMTPIACEAGTPLALAGVCDGALACGGVATPFDAKKVEYKKGDKTEVGTFVKKDTDLGKDKMEAVAVCRKLEAGGDCTVVVLSGAFSNLQTATSLLLGMGSLAYLAL